MIRKYLVTIKRNKVDFTSIELLMNMYNWVRSKGFYFFPEMGIEMDSLNRLHLHACMSADKVPYFKRYQYKGWIIHFQEINDTIEDLENVIRYIKKHSNKLYQSQMEIMSYAHYYNMFTN